MTGADVQLFLLNNAVSARANVSIYAGTGSLVIGPQPLIGSGETYVDIGTPGAGNSTSRVALQPQISRVTITNTGDIQIYLA